MIAYDCVAMYGRKFQGKVSRVRHRLPSASRRQAISMERLRKERLHLTTSRDVGFILRNKTRYERVRRKRHCACDKE